MKIRYTIILSAIFVFCFTGAHAAEIFTLDLRFEMSHLQVKQLQQLLNTDPATSLASSGAGSPGLETDYFGALTLASVIKFQEKYRSEILLPAGLSSGSGFVGSFTRTVLNRLLTPPVASPSVATSISAPSQPSVISSASAPQNVPEWLYSSEIKEVLAESGLTPDYFVGDNWRKYPHILYVSSNTASPGDTIILSGINLDDSTLTLTLGTMSVDFKKTASSTFQFTVPASLSYGYYDLSFQKNGSVYQKNEMGMMIKKKGALAPSITKVWSSGSNTPTLNDVITIEGKNFADKNDIVTTFGEILNVPRLSDNTLTFSFRAVSGLTELSSENQPAVGTVTTPVALFLRNENGVSGAYGPINLKL